MDVKTAIQTGNIDALRLLLKEDSSRANALIHWGREDRNRTHPLHYISDMLFDGTLRNGAEIAMIDALIEAGANIDFQSAPRTDTPLIGAASLGAEAVGLRLLEAGADPRVPGIFGETALHWAAMLGEDRLVAALIAGSDINLKDEKYGSSPLGWGIHGWGDPQKGNHGHHREVVALLRAAGATIEPHQAAELAKLERH